MDVKEKKMEESFKYHIPEDIPANERTAFHGAAAAAAKAGKKNFNFGGKTHPVTMKKDTANKIADQKESVNEAEYHPIKSSYHDDMAKAHASHAKRHKTEGDSGKHNDENEDMHYRAIDIHKQAHDAHKAAAAAASSLNQSKYKKAAKDAHSLSQTAIGTTKDAGKFKTGTPKHSFPKLKLHTKLTKLNIKSESTMTFREKLMSLFEGDRAAHYKGATKPEEYDEKQKSSKGAMDMLKTPKSVEADGMKAAKDTAANIAKSAPGRKMRSNDKKDGDNTIIPAATPVNDPSGKRQTMEGYGISGNMISNSLLKAISVVEDYTHEFDVDSEKSAKYVVNKAKKNGIKAKIHTMKGPGGGNPVVHLGHKDTNHMHKFIKKHYDDSYEKSDLNMHKL